MLFDGNPNNRQLPKKSGSFILQIVHDLYYVVDDEHPPKAT